MIEHPEVLSQSYFDIVLKQRKIPIDDLLTKVEYQLVRFSGTNNNQTDPFLNVTEILTHDVEPLHTIPISTLIPNTTNYFRARFVTMKGYVSPWSEPYILRVGTYNLIKPIIVDPKSGIDEIGSGIVLKLNDVHKHPYFYKYINVELQIYRINSNLPGYRYLSTIKLEPTEILTDSGNNKFNKGNLYENLVNITNKFMSNSQYMLRLNYSYQTKQSSGTVYTSDYSEDFYIKTKPYFLELARILTEPVTESVVVTTNVTTTVPPAPAETTDTTTVTNTNSSTLTIKNSIINGVIQVSPPKYIVPVDRVKLKVQVSGNQDFASLLVNINNVYNTTEVNTADLNFSVPMPGPGVSVVYYARASWTEYIEYTDSLGVNIIESPVNWGDVKIIELFGK